MKNLNHEEFNQVKDREGITVVDFYAEWCGPCKMLTPVLEQISAEVNSNVEFVKINLDENLPLAREYGVTTIPTLIFLKDGKELERTVGFVPKDKIKDIIENI